MSVTRPEGARGILRANVVGGTVESFPLFRCPACRQTGVIDPEQFYGLVSIQCECGYHETKNWSSAGATA